MHPNDIDRLPRIRLPKYLAAAEGRPCVGCGRNDGTVVAAHLRGTQVGLHHGTGGKCHDFAVAWLCRGCHAELDSDFQSDWAYRWKLMNRTLAMAFEEGVLVVR